MDDGLAGFIGGLAIAATLGAIGCVASWNDGKTHAARWAIDNPAEVERLRALKDQLSDDALDAEIRNSMEGSE